MHAQEISASRFVELCLGIVMSEIKILLHTHTHTLLFQNFTNRFFFITKITDAVAQCPYFFILAVPNQFRYPVWGQEPGSLVRRHRRFLTHKRIFGPSYYFTVGTNGNAMRCYISFQLAYRPTIHIPVVGIISPVEFAKSVSYGKIVTSA